MKFILEYQLPCVHRVQVGIEADSLGEAETGARTLFQGCDLHADVADRPLLLDELGEDGDAGVPLDFKLVNVLGPNDPWPEADATVRAVRRDKAARRVAELLVEAYRRGEERGGSVQWEDIDLAHELALAMVSL